MKTALLGIVLICLSFSIARSQSADPTPTAVPVAISSTSGVVPGNSTYKTGKAALVLPPEKSNPVRIVRFEKPPVIDGKLDDEVWKSSSVLRDFYQTQPGDNLVPENRTEVML